MEEIKQEDISSFISRKVEENTNLDYKDIRAYYDIDNLTKHVASFANSEGGLIILGVSEEREDKAGKIRIYPKEVTWGEVSLDKETLENKVMSKIKPPVTGLIITPVRNEKNQVIFLIDIPKSSFAPHMSPDHRYHKRMNFGTRVMEHYEVAHMFQINWTMKEKLIEKIYEPLSEILEKHAGQLNKYSCPFVDEVEKILARTFYKAKIPSELLDEIELYIENTKDLQKKEYNARKVMVNIATESILEYLKKEYQPLVEVFSWDFVRIVTTPRQYEVNFDAHLIYELLLTNQKVQPYLKTEHFQHAYDKISIEHRNETYYIDLDKFDELVWTNCLKRACQNPQIVQMKKVADDLWELAFDIIDHITRD